MSAAMFLVISAKIKRVFMSDNKDTLEVLGGIFRKSFVSKALLQLIACSIKKHMAKY